MITPFLDKYNLNLTKQQREAVESIEGPTLLLAVPGSGKTTTLVARLGYMIYEKQIMPENILVLTYTVAATRDMSERFTKVFGTEYKERLEFRTINGVCSKIISYYSKKIGKPAFELETDEKKKNARIASIYFNTENEYPTESEIRDVSTAITYIKNMMLSDDEIKKKSKEMDFDLEKIYQKYLASMQREGIMDYDDQMRYALNILKASPETLAYFQNIYRYICVDEAQDTSKIQHVIIALLANKYDNLFMVGDEDQSIYGFRAAYPDALLEFEKNHKDAKILVMEENFRSNAKIVEAADRFIQKNIFRHKKKMTPHREEGDEIKLKKLPSRPAQYEYLINKLSKTDKETAILYKNNESVIPLVDRLDREGIPYNIKNAELLFFTNRIVVDILDILHFALNPYDETLFMKIYYKMGLYMTKIEASTICNISKKHNIPLTLAAERLSVDTFKHEKIRDFTYDIKRLSDMKPASAISEIVNISGYRDYLEKNHIKEGKSYILREIARKCSDFSDFFKRLDDLQTIIKDNKYSPDNNIILSTIHSSKGLEYDTVYMLDIMDTIIPEKTPKFDAGKEERRIYEEERRMYYVGITRAKERLILLDTGEPSSFINETVKVFKPTVDPNSLFGKQKIQNNYQPSVSFEEFCKNLRKDKYVEHLKFGTGVITDVNIPYVTIEFKNETKTFSAKLLYEKNIIDFI